MLVLENSSPQERESLVRPLLNHLAHRGEAEDGRWRDWQIARVTGGRNNLLYRAVGPWGGLAVKFSIRDSRDRAGREYGALSALKQAKVHVAPAPILLDRTTYDQPVVVQAWLEGDVSAAPPVTEAELQNLAQHLAAVHTLTPEDTDLRLPQAIINPYDAEEGKEHVRKQVAHLPNEAQPPALRALVRRFEAARFPRCPAAPVTLCRLDNNITNYVRRPGLWASVDWEYSGWGDPASDVANLITHVALMEVPALCWPGFIDAYCSLVRDAAAALRIRTYSEIMVMWWATRLARYLYELPRGLDPRLAAWSDGWQTDIEAKYQHYVRLAETVYA